MIARLLILSFLLLSSRGLIQADPVDGQVKSVSGDAVLTTPGGKTEKITGTTVIPPKSKLRTNAGATLITEWLPGAFSIIYPICNVGISALDYTKPVDEEATRQVSLHLLKGSIFSHLAHQDGTADFSIKTPEGVAAARGTDWIVSCIGGIVRVTTLTGTVTVTLPSGKVVTVPALFTYVMGDADATHLTDDDLKLILQTFRDGRLSVTGTARTGYLITFTPTTGDGFQFFIPGWDPRFKRPEDWRRIPMAEPPFPKVPVASP